MRREERNNDQITCEAVVVLEVESQLSLSLFPPPHLYSLLYTDYTPPALHSTVTVATNQPTDNSIW